MATTKQSASSGFFRELVALDLYKRTQGRWSRQVTAVAIAVAIALGAYNLSQFFAGQGQVFQFWIPIALAIVGCWIAYRAVNVPRFADFLIAVEAEMNKVTWPTRSELLRASAVVIVTMFFLAFVLFVYDLFWIWILEQIGVR